MRDIYFDENYGKLYEKIENGKAEIFKLETENGTIINQFIKREIPLMVDGVRYYDTITPYGYGGPCIEKCVNKKELLKEYKVQFGEYVKRNNIVAEFVRFHPIYKNYKDFKDICNAEFNRYTLATNIKDYDNPVRDEFSKGMKKNIRRFLNKGVSPKVVDNPTDKDMAEFVRLYYLNMERLKAEEYYFFEKEHFDEIQRVFKGRYILAQAALDEKVIATNLCFVTDGNVHEYLAGADPDYVCLSPSCVLQYGVALWAKEKGINYVHYGGGLSASENDSLYIYKSKFAKNTKFEFWVGKKVWNNNVYNKLCQKTGVSENESFFPAYRKNMQELKIPN